MLHGIIPIEIKLGATIERETWKGIDYYCALNPKASLGMIVYGGEEQQQRSSGLRIDDFPCIGDIMACLYLIHSSRLFLSRREPGVVHLLFPGPPPPG